MRHDERAAGVYFHDLALVFELPGGHRSAGETAAQAAVVEQVARMGWPPAPVEVGGRGRCGEPLLTRPDGNGNHVLFQPLVVTYARIAAGLEHVNEAILRDDVQANVGIGGKEGWDDARQHEQRGADGHVEAQRAYRPVAVAVDHVQRGVDFSQSGAEALEETRACFGGHDAAGRTVEQPYAELSFQAAHRFAQTRGAVAADACRVPKAARAGYGDKGCQITQIRHCAVFRTGRADYTAFSHTMKLCTVAPRTYRRVPMTQVSNSGTFKLGDRRVKRLGYGAMQLAGPGVFGPPKDRQAALAVLREAVASGVDHIDTSDFYGPHVTNQIIREALHPYAKDLVIVTKISCRRGRRWLLAASHVPGRTDSGGA